MSEELRPLQESIAALRNGKRQSYELLGKLLTKRNFVELVSKFVPMITGESEILRIRVEDGSDWGWRSPANCAMIVCQGTRLMIENIRLLVERVYPHVIVLDRGQDDDYWVWRAELVSKRRHRSQSRGVRSPVFEDNIHDVIDYYNYGIHHGLQDVWMHCRARGFEPHTTTAVWWQPFIRDGGKHDLPWFEGDRRQLTQHLKQESPHAVAICAAYFIWRIDYRLSLWCNQYSRVASLAILFAPFVASGALTPYTLLWILDYALSGHTAFIGFAYYDEAHRPYDLNHLRKLRLIEGVAASYEKIKGV